MDNNAAIIDELWRRGAIAPVYLRDYQMQLYKLLQDTNRDIVVPNIARRFGKSTVCVVDVIETAMSKKCDVRYATAFLTDLEGFIIPIFDSVLSSCPDDIRPRYLKSKKIYEFANGSTIKLVGLDKNLNGIRGNAIDHLVIDEAAFVSNLRYIYTSIIVPATANRNFKIVFPSTPPTDSEHFWLELVKKAKDRKNYIELTIEDNTNIDERERDRLLEEVGGKDSITAQREFYCKVVRDPRTTIIPEFNADINVKTVQMPEFIIPQTTIDFGGSVDKCGIILGYYDFAVATYIIYKSLLINANTTTKEILSNVLAMEARYFPTYTKIDRVVDCFGQTRTDLGAEAFYTRPPKKEKGSVEANINQIRLAFQKQQLIVHPEGNDDLIATLELGQWTKSGDFKRTDTLGHCDLLAALSYAFRERRTDNPSPELFKDRLNIMEHINGNRKRSERNWLIEHITDESGIDDYDI